MGMLTRFYRKAALSMVTAVFLAVPALTAAMPAQAGVLDGLKGCYLAAEAASQIAATATDPKFVACSGQFTSGDPILIALTVVMAVLAANGNITSEASCNALVYGSAASFLGDALVAAGVLSKSDGEQMKSAATAGSTELIEGILNSIGVGQQVGCACSLAGNAVEVTKLMVALAEHGGKCAGMAGAMSQAIAEGVASGIYGAGEWVHSLGGTKPAACTTGSGGYIIEGDSSVGACAPGKFSTTGYQSKYKSNNPASFVTLFGSYNDCPPEWEDECGFCDFSKQPPGYDPTPYDKQLFVFGPGGMCYCPPPTKLQAYGGGIGTPGNPKPARCVCPEGLGYTAKGTCEACSLGTQLGPDGTCVGCPAGSTGGQTPGKCVPACKPGEVFKNGKCMTCEAGSVPKYNASSNTSAATCEKCPSGTSAQPGDQYCSNLCSYGSEWNGKACVSLCGAGEYVVFHEFDHSCKKCPDGTVFSYDTLQCEKCPGDTKWEESYTGGSCSCPQGETLVNGKCTKCKGVIADSWTDGGKCLECPGDSVWTQGKEGGYCKGGDRPFIQCGGNAIPDKKAPYEKCVPCPKDHYAFAGMCIPSKSIRDMGMNPKFTPPSAKDLDKLFPVPCPPGFVALSPGLCVPGKREGDNTLPPPVEEEKIDCRKLGSNYIADTKKPGACKKCPMGRIANAAGTACVLGYSTPPRMDGDGKKVPGYDIPKGGTVPDTRTAPAPDKRTYTPPPPPPPPPPYTPPYTGKP